MLTPMGSTRLQRFLRGAVACLLTANGFALVLLAADSVSGPAPAEQGVRTVAIIRAADGTTTEVDPSTPAGRAAIEQAREDGATVTETTVPVAVPGGVADDDAPAGSPLARERSTSTLPRLPLDPNDVLDDAQDLLDDTIDDIQKKVPTPLDDTIDDAQDTIGDTVDDVQETVTTVLEPKLPVVTTTTTTTTTNVVDDTVGDVTDTVDGLTGGVGL